MLNASATALGVTPSGCLTTYRRISLAVTEVCGCSERHSCRGGAVERVADQLPDTAFHGDRVLAFDDISAGDLQQPLRFVPRPRYDNDRVGCAGDPVRAGDTSTKSSALAFRS